MRTICPIDEMSYVEFDEVEAIFRKNRIWCTDNEIYWYSGIWERLEEHNLTGYVNEWDRYTVIIRAVTVFMIYAVFNEYAFHEEPSFDYVYDESVMEYIPPFELGQMYYQQFGETTLDVNYALLRLADLQLDTVMQALKENGTWDALFFSLTAVHHSFSAPVEEGGEIYDEEVEPESPQEFWKLFRDSYEEVVHTAEADVMNLSGSYEWLLDGAYLSGSYEEHEIGD